MVRLLVPALVALLAGGCAASQSTDTVEQGEQDLTSGGESLAPLRIAVHDVELEHVVFAALAPTPTASAIMGSRGEQTSIYGIDWYQRWSGGKSADHVWENGSDYGRRCAWASMLRFEAIMGEPPVELAELRAQKTSWTGGFENWNDDYGGRSADGKPAYSDAKSSRIFSPRDGTVKWVSATARDGSCFVPTRTMLLTFLRKCTTRVASTGSTKGCEVTTAQAEGP